jgi:hypothetical protein
MPQHLPAHSLHHKTRISLLQLWRNNHADLPEGVPESHGVPPALDREITLLKPHLADQAIDLSVDLLHNFEGYATPGGLLFGNLRFQHNIVLSCWVFRDDLNPCCFSRIEESSEPRSSHRPHGTRESLFVGPTRPTLTRARCCQGWRLHSNPIPSLWRLDTQTKSSIRDVVLIDDEALVSSMRKRSDGGGLQVKADRSLSSHCASSSLFTGIGMWTN